MDYFLLGRGLRTLNMRIQRHGENMMAVARMMEDHPMEAEVYYPGLESHPERDMADLTFRYGRNCAAARGIYIYTVMKGMMVRGYD